MKKIIILTALTLVSYSAMALKKTGRVINLVQDEEGVNIILESNDEKKSVTTHYLSNRTETFVDAVSQLEAAKEYRELVVIDVSDKNQSQVLKIEIKK